MCGICGILGPGATFEQETIVAEMMASLHHRGPDGEGRFSGNNFCFGHRRLAIIDLEHGKQPMVTPDGRYVVVFNGEIYNYVELRSRLTQQGTMFKTFSDTEVLLHMLVRHGCDALPQLNGMFAFVFYDTHTGEWMMARDPFGIKPLYFKALPDKVIFASEIKALFRHPLVSPSRNWKAMQQYLTFQFCLSDATLFDGIQKLEPGCFARGKGGKISQTIRYWDTDYTIDEYHTEEYFTDRLRTLLEDSVALQIRSDVPLGTYLSGGLDSSVVTAMAADHLGGQFKAFTGRFAEGEQYDESPYARLVAKEVSTELHEVVPTARDFVEHISNLIYAMDEPVAGPGLFPQYMVSRLASQHVKVVLGGQGGDEIFGGYARYLVAYLEQALKGAIFENQEEGQHIVTLSSIIKNLPVLKNYSPLMQQFWKDGLFGEMDARYFRLIDRSPDVEQLLSKDACAAFDRQYVFEEFQKVFNHPDTRSYVNKMTHFDQKTLLPALLQVEDRVSMAVSLESRVPLLDTRIVDLVTKMPPAMKFQGGKTKYILKQAARNRIPEAVLTRKDKMGFPVPLKEWLTQGPVREFVNDILLGKTTSQRGLFDCCALERMVQSEGAFGRQLWGALCIELWHRRFLDAV